MNALQLRDNAKQQLAEIKTIETGVEYLNKVKAIETWAKAEKKDAELQNIIAEQKLRTQRILGGLIPEYISRGNQKGSNGREIVKSQEMTLQNFGITRNQSSAFQKISNLPQEIFEEEIAIAKVETNKRIELTTSRMLKAVKDYEKEETIKNKQKKGSKINITNDLIDYRLGDFVEQLKNIPNGSIDCIITDPPYPLEHIECWTNLAKEAKRLLKPNGFCIAYSGQQNLIEVYNRMNKYLDYYWTFSLNHSGNSQFIRYKNILCGWKPILVFQNGFKKIDIVSKDVITGSGMEKEYHEWQQSEKELIYIIEKFTKIGDTILEPFAGSGTTIVAAAKLKRKVIACEIDEKSYNISKVKIKNLL
tara:strand:- start:16412 stop:17497 length:1086 start_codon:yes stop_codon:yes gene_type:complete